jgi:hypothetical protein
MTSCMTWLVPAAGPERERLTGAIGLDLQVTIRIDAAELWVDFREPVAGWRRVARVPLAG